MSKDGEPGRPGHGCTSFTQRKEWFPRYDRRAEVPPKPRKPSENDPLVLDHGWLYVHCSCGHRRAVALVPWAMRWGVRDPSSLIRKRFRCVMCGKIEIGFQVGGYDRDTALRDFPFPSPSVSIGGLRNIPEPCIAADARNRAFYESRRHIWGRFWLE